MQRTFSLIFCVLILMGCSRPSIKTELDTFEKSLTTDPHATYRLLLNEHPVSEEDKARCTILTIKAKNLAYIHLEGTDTLPLLKAIAYYCQQDNMAMQMEGYYLLGSIYRDLGDAPRGIRAFNRVIEVADTMNKDCDYRLMARAEAQKSDLQNGQKVWPMAIESANRAMHYALKARDTSYVFDLAFGLISLHTHGLKSDQLSREAPRLVRQCLTYGDTLMVVKYAHNFAWLYLEMDSIREADMMVKLYDRLGKGVFPIDYETRGRLALAKHQLDSAEYYFRKGMQASDWNNLQADYRGLKEVFERRHQTDSALKYATLQCDAVDSDYHHKMTESIIQMEHLYNYESEQEYARQSEKERQKLMFLLNLVGGAAIAIAVIVLLLLRNSRIQHQKRLAEDEQKRMRLQAQFMKGEHQRKEVESKAEKMSADLLQIRMELLELEQERNAVRDELAIAQQNINSSHLEKEKNNQYIRKLEEDLRQKEQDIHASEEELKHKSSLLILQQEELNNMQDDLDVLRGEAQQMETYSDVILLLKRRIAQGKTATNENWAVLQKYVVRLYPTFIRTLQQQAIPLQERELQIAMLVKLKFAPKDIATLIGRTPQSVTMARRRLYEKAYGYKPETMEEVDKWLIGL